MKHLLKNIILVALLFLVPLISEGKSTEGESFIQEIKEKIVKEKEKEQEKVEVKDKDKNEVEKPIDEESRIKKVKETIVKEKKKIENKVVAKGKEKDKHKEKHYYGNDYQYKNHYDRRYHNKKYRDYYPDIYWTHNYSYPNVSYYDYSYVDDSDLIYSKPVHEYRQPKRKIISLASSIEAAYLGKDIDDTYGATAKVSANLFSFHFNCFYQNIFSSEESLTLYSINGGYSFEVQNFTLTPFIGAFYMEPLEEAELSYGADLQIVLPDNYNLDLYTLNSSYGSLNFHNFSATLNRELYIFNIGMGFNYNNYAGISFSGPIVKLSLCL